MGGSHQVARAAATRLLARMRSPALASNIPTDCKASMVSIKMVRMRLALPALGKHCLCVGKKGIK